MSIFNVLLMSILIVGAFGLVQIDWGILYPIDDPPFVPLLRRAANLRVKQLNEDEVIPGAEIVLSIVPIDALMTRTEKMGSVVESIMENPNMSTMIGFHNSRQVDDPNTVSAIFKIPMVGSAATSPKFSNKEKYPYFGRIITQSGKISLATGDFCQFSGFRRAAHLGSTTYSVGRVEPIAKSFEDANIQFIGSRLHDTLNDEPADVIIKQMEHILTYFKEQGINIITYTSQNEEGHLVLWVAWRLGMLGPQPDGRVYQWHVADDMSGTHAYTDDCAHPQCAKDMKYVREAAKGLIAFETNFDINQEWFENVWLPDVTPADKLSAEEIAISGSDDWDKDFFNFAVFAYDAPYFMAEVINSYCASVNDTMTLEECYMDLPNAGDQIMKHYPIVKVEGITGTISLDENLDREMNQVMYQWMGESFETSAYWTQYPDGPQINHKLGNTTQGSFEWVKPPLYMSMDGVPPKTLHLSGAPAILKYWSYFCGIIAILMTCLFIFLQKKDKRQMMRSRQFFGPRMVIWITIVITGAFILKLTNASLMISPEKSMVPIATLVQFFDWIPMVIVTASIGSRLYRFCKVTNNKKMRSLKFSKLHSLYSCVIAVSIPMMFVLYWIYKTVDETGSLNGAFEKLYTLQDENPSRFFELAPPLYKLHANNRTLSTLNLLIKGGCKFALACGCLVLARMSQQRNSGGISHSNKQMDHQLSIIERAFGLVCIIYIIEGVFDWSEHKNDMSIEVQKMTHIGFDNINHNVTFDNMVGEVIIKMGASIFVWVVFMTTIFMCSLRHSWRVLTKGLDMDVSSTVNVSSSGISTVEGHGLSLDLAARLQMASFTLNGDKTMETGDYGGSISFGKNLTSDMTKDTSRTISAGEAKFTSASIKGRQSGVEFSQAGFGRKVSISGTNEEFDPRKYMQELNGMDKDTLDSLVRRLKNDVDRLISSSGRLYAQLHKLDSKLPDELFALEVLSVKNKRSLPTLAVGTLTSQNKYYTPKTKASAFIKNGHSLEITASTSKTNNSRSMAKVTPAP